jgi:hypothetical protein
MHGSRSEVDIIRFISFYVNDELHWRWNVASRTRLDAERRNDLI